MEDTLLGEGGPEKGQNPETLSPENKEEKRGKSQADPVIRGGLSKT
jgi:hypothetical protein